MRKFLVLLGALISAVAFSRSPIEPPIIVSPPNLREWSGDTIKTSGEDFVGIAGNDIRSSVFTGLIRVAGLRPGERFICVYVERASGLYTASFVQKRKDDSPTVLLKIDSNVLRRLGAKNGEFAIRAQASDTESCRPDSAYLPVSSGTEPIRKQYLMINSQTASSISALWNAGSKLQCEDLSTAIKDDHLVERSFDKVCKVPDIPCGIDAEITLIRRNGLDIWPRVARKVRGYCK